MEGRQEGKRFMEEKPRKRHISNRRLKLEVARAIAKERDRQAVLLAASKPNLYKSASWVTVPPRAKVTDPRKVYYNRGDYVAYSTNIGMWLTRDRRINN